MSEQISLFSRALSVTDLTRYLRQLLESDEVLQDIWVTGEISNLSRPSSGHVYLTLKDAAAFGDVTSDVLVRVMTPQDSVFGTAPPVMPSRFIPLRARGSATRNRTTPSCTVAGQIAT